MAKVEFTRVHQPLRFVKPHELPNIEGNARANHELGQMELANINAVYMPSPEKVAGHVTRWASLRSKYYYGRFFLAHMRTILRVMFGRSKNPIADSAGVFLDLMPKLGLHISAYGTPVHKDVHGVTAIVNSVHGGFFDGPTIAALTGWRMAGTASMVKFPVIGKLLAKLVQRLGTVLIPREKDIADETIKIPGFELPKDPVTGLKIVTSEAKAKMRDLVSDAFADAITDNSLVYFGEGEQGDLHNTGYFKPGALRALFDQHGKAVPGKVAQGVVIDLEKACYINKDGKVAVHEFKPGYRHELRSIWCSYGHNGGYAEGQLGHTLYHVMSRPYDERGHRLYVGVHFLDPLNPADYEVAGKDGEESRDLSAKNLADAMSRQIRHGLLYPPRKRAKTEAGYQMPTPFKVIKFS
ncbi:MAG: hypothetical protein KGQ41_02370 [Alphaproteobacteria bacterium]|nr:hypothetical protein [Alphaproteobacteria bacterium]